MSELKQWFLRIDHSSWSSKILKPSEVTKQLKAICLFQVSRYKTVASLYPLLSSMRRQTFIPVCRCCAWGLVILGALFIVWHFIAGKQYVISASSSFIFFTGLSDKNKTDKSNMYTICNMNIILTTSLKHACIQNVYKAFESAAMIYLRPLCWRKHINKMFQRIFARNMTSANTLSSPSDIKKWSLILMDFLDSEISLHKLAMLGYLSRYRICLIYQLTFKFFLYLG